MAQELQIGSADRALPLAEQARLLRARELSSEELIVSYLDRIDAYDRDCGAFVTARTEEARTEAREIDKRRGDSAARPTPFRGVPISIADLVETAGTRTTFSSGAMAEHVPTMDAAPVRLLKNAGFVVIGKTNVSEFGRFSTTESILNGVCRNPWHLAHTAGGPCGGAAAAVAAGFSSVSYGVNGAGSLRTPASCCGLVGFTPTAGSGVRDVHPLAPDGDGVIGSTVEDVQAVAAILAGAAELPDALLPGCISLRIAFTTVNPLSWPPEPECVAAVRRAAYLLGELGHEMEEVSLDVDFAVYDDLMRVRTTVPRALAGASEEIGAAVLREHARHVCDQWREHELLLTTTVLRPPVVTGWQFEEPGDEKTSLHREELLLPLFTLLANVAGQPAVTVPLQRTKDGLPIGVQLIGRPGGDRVVLEAGAQLEQARGDFPRNHHSSSPHAASLRVDLADESEARACG